MIKYNFNFSNKKKLNFHSFCLTRFKYSAGIWKPEKNDIWSNDVFAVACNSHNNILKFIAAFSQIANFICIFPKC